MFPEFWELVLNSSTGVAMVNDALAMGASGQKPATVVG
jgi:hypothetical protein